MKSGAHLQLARTEALCRGSEAADGLPVGVMFAGRFGEDATLFRLAAQLEKAQPGDKRMPQLLPL